MTEACNPAPTRMNMKESNAVGSALSAILARELIVDRFHAFAPCGPPLNVRVRVHTHLMEG